MRSLFVSALLGAALIACLPAAAQSPGRVYRVGWLDSGQSSVDVPTIIHEALSSRGFVEGKNLSIQRIRVVGSRDELAASARDLVAARPDLLMTGGTTNTRLLQSLTTTIPIVFVGAADPVTSGLVKTLAHPGANTTGVSNLQCAFGPKLLEVAHELVPQAARIALIMGGTRELNPCAPSLADLRSGNVPVDVIWVDPYAGAAAASAALTTLARVRPDILIVHFTGPQVETIVKSIAETKGRRIPIVSSGASGAAVWLNIDIGEVARLGADQVARILGGTPPADLPVALASRYRMEIDLRAAKAQGIRIPESILVRADRIIR